MHAAATTKAFVGRLSVVPKVIDDTIKARAVALLVELRNAERAAAQVMLEYPGTSVTGNSVRRWASGLNLKLQPGRKKGDPGIVSRVSPWREKVADCAARGLTQAETVRELGISRQEVSRYWPRS